MLSRGWRFGQHLAIYRLPMCKTMATRANDEIILQQINDKGLITLNRPKAMNSLRLAMVKQMHQHLKTWQSDGRTQMVVIKGAGDQAFCSGVDIVTIANAGRDSKLSHDFFREEYQMINLISKLIIPYLALIDGFVMGAGVGLSVHGTFRVATERSVLAMPGTAIGFYSDVGASFFLPQLPGQLGLFLALTGHRLVGWDLIESGLATHFVTSNFLPKLEAELVNLKTSDNKAIDNLLSEFQKKSEAGHRKEFTLKPVINAINSLFGVENVDQIIASLKKDNSKWSQQQLEVLKKKSPTSLKVNFEVLRRGKHMKSLAECLAMEYRVSRKLANTEDFFNGVRAVLVDKTHNAKWQPPTVEEVTNDQVLAFFAPLPDPKQELDCD